jgi:Ca2+-transporting ATPase
VLTGTEAVDFESADGDGGHRNVRSGSKEAAAASREFWLGRADEMAGRGLRVIALAEKVTFSREEEPYSELTLLGLAGLEDPARPEIGTVIETCRHAGIRVVMVTGDNPRTAEEIAGRVGLLAKKEARVLQGGEISEAFEGEERDLLLSVDIFARVDPKQKLSIIGIHQKNGSVVAMTGDGVNDAPALKKADIGVAMGKRGTEVAREASDMILRDDSFSAIVHAVEQGRNIFSNIRRFIIYLFSCNLAEIIAVGLASVLALPLPVNPLQILFLNLVTGVFPALALGVGKGDPGLMKRPSRDRKEPVLGKRHWGMLILYSFIISASVLGALLTAIRVLGLSGSEAVTVSFLVLGFSHLWHVFNMRERGGSFFRNGIPRNQWVWLALLLCTILLPAAVYLPGLSDVLKTGPPGAVGWFVISGMSLVPLVIGQVLKTVLRGGRRLFL